MRAVVQRVSSAEVRVEEQLVGRIGPGLLVLLGVGRGDVEADADYLADRVVNLRVFPDEKGQMNRSILEADGAVLVVSQFTLYGDCRRGRRPSFTDAAPPELAEQLYEAFVAIVKRAGIEVATGRFREHMDVSLVNDGPVTLWIDTAEM